MSTKRWAVAAGVAVVAAGMLLVCRPWRERGSGRSPQPAGTLDALGLSESVRLPMSREELLVFRGKLRSRAAAALGLPESQARRAPRFQARPLGRETRDDLVLERFRIRLEPEGEEAEAFIRLPSGRGPYAGVCVWPDGSAEALAGRKRPRRISQHAVAAHLAKQGFAAVTLEWTAASGQRGGGHGPTSPDARRQDIVLRSRLCLAAAELLDRDPRVSRHGLAAVGLGAGGELAALTALLSERIAVVCLMAQVGRPKLPALPDATAGQQARELTGLEAVLVGACPKPLLLCVPRVPGHTSGPTGGLLQVMESQYAALGAKENFVPWAYKVQNPRKWIGGAIVPFVRIYALPQPGGIASLDPTTRPQAGRCPALLQGAMAGEVTSDSVILQTRLTQPYRTAYREVPGAAGVARFELSRSAAFSNPIRTAWQSAVPNSDYIVKTKVAGLSPATVYHYRVRYGPNRSEARTGSSGKFRTLGGKRDTGPVSFVVVTGMNYFRFHFSENCYRGPDKRLGPPALDAIAALQPEYFFGTGDNVYLDAPSWIPALSARTRQELRRCYHEQFVQNRFVRLFAKVGTYWQIDDHDFRFDDADPYMPGEPSAELGLRIFREQLPVVSAGETEAKTYRTHRLNSLVQVWLPEGRAHRSPNSMPDGPAKSYWGPVQRRWLKRTLKESDAPFKIIIHPTALVGPDNKRKSDNHTSAKGFLHEGREFFRWLRKEGISPKRLFICSGDRHCQYHAVHPLGYEEFACGALVQANASVGYEAGDPRSTDPEGTIKQLYRSTEATGGFLHIAAEPTQDVSRGRLVFTFYDTRGKQLYRVVRRLTD